MLIEMLSKEKLLIEADRVDAIDDGAFIVRSGKGVAQIARVTGKDDGALIIQNIIDLTSNTFVAEQGIIRPGCGDSVLIFNSRYGSDDASRAALDIIVRSALFERYASHQRMILEFVRTTFAPRYILFLEEIESLQNVFVPIQQRFRIGRFSVRDKWETINSARFREMLDRLIENEYLTYMGYIPMGSTAKPVFYSLGTETHLETDLKLKKEPLLYPSNCGGNIKLHKMNGGKKYFLVDAGSSYKGNGVNARLDEARSVSSYLKSLYPELQFIPVEGRGAIGSRYSF